MNPIQHKPRNYLGNISVSERIKIFRNKFDLITPANKRQKSRSFNYKNLHLNKNYEVFPKGYKIN